MEPLTLRGDEYAICFKALAWYALERDKEYENLKARHEELQALARDRAQRIDHLEDEIERLAEALDTARDL